MPALYLHGATDGCMGAELVDDTVLTALPHEDSRAEIIEGAGHFLHLEQPEVINRLIVDFVSAA
jgi:pimeloyl-ACP methyl ester carboxylesterase